MPDQRAAPRLVTKKTTGMFGPNMPVYLFNTPELFRQRASQAASSW